MSIASLIKEIKAEIGSSCKLVAVSKTKPIEQLKEAYDAGQRDFGENKVQELTTKVSQLPGDINWHFIGHLQSKKVKQIVSFVHLIHAVDSEKLLLEIEKRAIQNSRTIDCLLQVFIAEEETKFGFSNDEIHALLSSPIILELRHVRIRGLMGMATNTANENQVRSEFRKLRLLYEELKSAHHFDTLSMGMTGDYKIALEEGSNMVRIGSLIFGERH